MFAHPSRGWSEQDFMRIFVHYDFDRQGTAIHIARRKPGQLAEETQIVSVEWKDVAWGEQHSPALVLQPDTLQHLFNALWEQGLRPPIQIKQDAITEAHLQHLEDFRKIIFNQLEIESGTTNP
jgi:hypothetical protein